MMKPSSWNHKFRTPRKKRLDLFVENAVVSTTPNNTIDKRKNRPHTDKAAGVAYKRNGNKRKVNNIPITHDIMRSISAAIAYIEELGGLSNKELYRDIHADTYSSLADDIMVSKNQILRYYPSGHSIGVKSISQLSNNNLIVISEAFKLGLKSCEPLVPYEMCEEVMQIQHGGEIERLLSSSSWPDSHRIAFILLLHHLGKIVSNDNMNKEIILDRLAIQFSKILLREARRPFRKKRSEKAKTRVIKLVIKHMLDDNVSATCDKYDSRKGKDERLNINAQSNPPLYFQPDNKKLKKDGENAANYNVDDMYTTDEFKETAETLSLQEEPQNSCSMLNGRELDKRIINLYIRHEELVKRTKCRLQAALTMIQHIDSYELKTNVSLQ